MRRLIGQDLFRAQSLKNRKDNFHVKISRLTKENVSYSKRIYISELQEEFAQLRANVNSQTDREALEAEVKELWQNIVSPKSTGIHQNSQIHF